MLTSVNTKAPISTTSATTQVDSALSLKADRSSTYTKAQVNAFLDAKPDDADLDLKADKLTSYTKTEVADQIAVVVASAPALLDTRTELSAALMRTMPQQSQTLWLEKDLSPALHSRARLGESRGSWLI